jgi:heme-degrading monooxygenase HmoA
MTITEIALLHLASSITIEDADLRSALAHAKAVMEGYTGNTFYYFQQTEDPSYIYIFGEWESLDQHMNHFIPGAENQAVLESLKDKMTVDWLLHADVSHADLPLPFSDAERAKALRGELVLCVGRHFVKEGKREMFQESFKANKHHLQNYVTEGTIGGGWRIDIEGGRDEWVLLCPFKDVQQHLDFAKSEGFEHYAQIREYIDGAEIKHAKLLDIRSLSREYHPCASTLLALK